MVDAYTQLAAEGYLVARHGAPTRVSEAAARPATAGRAPPEERPPRLDFRPGGPDVSHFPRAAWSASIRRGLRDAPHARLDYCDPRGAPELRRVLASYLGRVRGVVGDPGSVIVTSGMAQGMALVGRTVVGRGGRRIGVEDPGSGPGRAQLAATGLEPRPVPRRAGPPRRRARRGGRRPGAHHSGAPVPHWRGSRPRAPRRAARLGRRRRARLRGRLRRGVPLRPCAGGRRAGTVARARRAPREREQDARTGAPAGLARRPRAARRRTGAGEGRGRPRHADHRAARPGGLPRARRARSSPGPNPPRLPPPARRPDRRAPAPPPGDAAERRRGRAASSGPPAGRNEAAVLEAARARGLDLQGLAEHRLVPGAPALLLGYGRIAEPAIDAGVRELAAAIRSPS